MPIIDTEIELRLSGGAANSNPAASLGGAKSSVAVTLSTLFDTVTGDEAASGDVEYRCIYVHNADPALTLTGAKVWITANAAQADGIAIALGGEGLNGTAETVANENTAPAGETFSTPTVEGSALSMGDIPPGQHYPLWIRRDVNAGAPAANDGFTLRVKGETLP